jgi:MFS family permease
MVWVCIMFAALNIDRNNISNAVSDNMLDDIGITRFDYNLGQTISRVGFLVAELPSQLISKRIGPDLWIPIQICIFSLISAMQFFLKGRASFLATRYLIATFQGGFIPDTILYLSYFYTGKSLPIRLAWFWMSSQLVDIGVGFAAVGLVSMRGILGYEGWRWLFLIEYVPRKDSITDQTDITQGHVYFQHRTDVFLSDAAMPYQDKELVGP